MTLLMANSLDMCRRYPYSGHLQEGSGNLGLADDLIHPVSSQHVNLGNIRK